jgi:hypothetical protein
VNLLETRNARGAASDETGNFIGAKFLLARDEVDDPKKKNEVLLDDEDNQLHQHPNRIHLGKSVEFSKILKDADDGGLSALDPGAQRRISTVEMSEFVRQHSTQFADIEDGEEGQTDAHYAPTAESKKATAVRDKGVGLPNQIDFAGNRIIQSGCDRFNFLEEQRLQRTIE